MQPNQPNEDWQQPVEQPSNTPHPQAPATSSADPVVTMQPATNESVSPPVTARPLQSTTDNLIEDETEFVDEPVDPANQPVHWQAQEYIHHEKNFGWFVIFGLAVVALMAIAIFLMNSWSFAILIPVMAAALIVYTHRPPRILDYTLSQQGLHVNDHLYAFAEFKSFGVIHDGQEYSIMLIPVKRFKPGVSVYFPEEAGEAIVDMLGLRLPMEELHLDLVDRLIRKLRI